MQDEGQLFNPIGSIIDDALAEDCGTLGDVTSRAVFEPGMQATAEIRAKEAGVLSGTFLIEPLFRTIDAALTVTLHCHEGERVETGTRICSLAGSIHAILAGERTILNFLQRLSGIATQTARLVSAIEGTGAVLLDTRKTTPLLRWVEKKAVVAGGGRNHRFGLYDMILIKDTHVCAAGGVGKAIRRAQAFRSSLPSLAIEAEVQSFEEFQEACDAAPDRIMLDNMSLSEMTRCVAWRNEKRLTVELEASGNVVEASIRSIAETGVDFISTGAITHSVRALDIHLTIT